LAADHTLFRFEVNGRFAENAGKIAPTFSILARLSEDGDSRYRGGEPLKRGKKEMRRESVQVR
jgi:hypothetical protein